MSRYKCYLYGSGKVYNHISSRIHLYNEYISLLGILTSHEPIYKEIDSLPCYKASSERIKEADFIIIAVENWKEIYQYLVFLGASDNQIIRSTVFDIPYFDFEEYIQLKNQKVTILANSCLAGRIYKELGLPMRTPTINVSCLNVKEFIDFVENIEVYKDIELKKCVEEKKSIIGTYNREMFIPSAHLDNKVLWLFPHTNNLTHSIDKWNRKIKEINLENLAVVCILYSDEEAIAFDNLKLEKKVGFYYKDLGLSSVLYLPEWNDEAIRFKYDYNFAVFVHRYVTNIEHKSKIDWIKFLKGRQDYIRY